MSAELRAEDLSVGDVVEDAYGNPAVVLEVLRDPMRDGRVYRVSVMQLYGSDRGRTASPGAVIRRVPEPQAERARELAREIWRANPARYRR